MCQGNHPSVQWAGERTSWAKLSSCWGGRMEEGDCGMGKEERLRTGLGFMNTSVWRTLLCPALGTPENTWLQEGQPRLFPHLQTQKFSSVLDTPTCHPVGHLVFSMPTSALTVFSDPSLGSQPASPRGLTPRPCVTLMDKDSLPGAIAWASLGWNCALIHPVSWVTNVPALPCPAEAARGDDTGRLCSLDDPLQQRWGSLPRCSRPPHTCQPASWTSEELPLLFLALVSRDSQPVLFWIFFLPGARGLSNSTCNVTSSHGVPDKPTLSLKPTTSGAAENDHGGWWGQRISWEDVTGSVS